MDSELLKGLVFGAEAGFIVGFVFGLVKAKHWLKAKNRWVPKGSVYNGN